ncbi:uncharacterized protein [Coffea arabica]|uniref:Agenet domain-containing protein n=1 Tax=Coffea arabica TaxID=13443 RepID=A0ABM4UG04_COFAR
MGFERGEQVEVVMEDEGFKGSYYPAIIISKKGTSRYKVEYTTLLKDDESGPLEAVIDVDQLRPVPPPMPVMDFDLHDLADAYEHDGWWGGIIYKKFELDYLVYFPTLGKALAYPSEKLRIHQEWANGRWTCTKSANKSFEEKQAKKSPKGKQAKKKNVSLPKPTVVEFQTGQKMGMIEEEEGFEGPYNSANIISIEGPVDVEEKTGQLSKKKQAKRSSKGKQAKKKNIGLPKPTAVEFQTRQELEVIKVEEGFEGPVDIEGKTGQISKKKQAKMSFRGKQAKKKNIGLPIPTAVELQSGQELEVMIEKEGFEGSYNAANLKSSEGPSQYPLEYKTLWKESKSGPLVEVVGDDQLLLLPPHVLVSCSGLSAST